MIYFTAVEVKRSFFPLSSLFLASPFVLALVIVRAFLSCLQTDKTQIESSEQQLTKGSDMCCSQCRWAVPVQKQTRENHSLQQQ